MALSLYLTGPPTPCAQGQNTVKYAQTVQLYNARTGQSVALDQAWIDATDRQAKQKLEHLEAELSGSKTNLMKERIRMGHNDVGDFYYERGDLMVSIVICVISHTIGLAAMTHPRRVHDSCLSTLITVLACMAAPRAPLLYTLGLLSHC